MLFQITVCRLQRILHWLGEIKWESKFKEWKAKYQGNKMKSKSTLRYSGGNPTSSASLKRIQLLSSFKLWMYCKLSSSIWALKRCTSSFLVTVRFKPFCSKSLTCHWSGKKSKLPLKNSFCLTRILRKHQIKDTYIPKSSANHSVDARINKQSTVNQVPSLEETKNV